VMAIIMLREVARAMQSRNFTSLNNTGRPPRGQASARWAAGAC
jgi:hypothetical protein